MTPTQAQIEAAARAIAEAEGSPGSAWPNWTEASKNKFRELARLALTAAAEVAMREAEEADTAKALDIVERDFP